MQTMAHIGVVGGFAVAASVRCFLPAMLRWGVRCTDTSELETHHCETVLTCLPLEALIEAESIRRPRANLNHPKDWDDYVRARIDCTGGHPRMLEVALKPRGISRRLAAMQLAIPVSMEYQQSKWAHPTLPRSGGYACGTPCHSVRATSPHAGSEEGGGYRADSP